MGVLPPVFRLLNFYQLHYTTNLVSHQKMLDEASTKMRLKIKPPLICTIGYWKCMFVNPFIKYTCPLNCVHY